MRLEEQLRATVAEVEYRVHQERELEATHALEGENLNLEPVRNDQRGFGTGESKGNRPKQQGDCLSRELRRFN